MTIDEAITYNLRIAEGQDKCADISVSEHAKERMRVCAANNRQLAEWLTELKQWRRVYGVCPSYEMCISECKEGYNAQIQELEAKHWDECRQIAHYDDELKEAKRLLKHGRWLGDEVIQCSNCNFTLNGASFGRIVHKYFDYCPKCGARMDGDTNDRV